MKVSVFTLLVCSPLFAVFVFLNTFFIHQAKMCGYRCLQVQSEIIEANVISNSEIYGTLEYHGHNDSTMYCELTLEYNNISSYTDLIGTNVTIYVNNDYSDCSTHSVNAFDDNVGIRAGTIIFILLSIFSAYKILVSLCVAGGSRIYSHDGYLKHDKIFFCEDPEEMLKKGFHPANYYFLNSVFDLIGILLNPEI